MFGRTSGLIGLASLGLMLGCDPGSSPDAPQPYVNSTLPQGCATGELLSPTGCVAPKPVRVNSVGYLPERMKLATLRASKAKTFDLLDAKTRKSVLSGKLTASALDPDTGESLQRADFSSFKTPGRYLVSVAGVGESAEFAIGGAVYAEVARLAMLGFYGQRCGSAVELTLGSAKYAHAACHLADASTELLAGADGKSKHSGVGGWHDAGDYGKYTANAAFSLAFLLRAWEESSAALGGIKHIPGGAGKLPDWLAEAKVQLDQLFTMQLTDGSVSHQIGVEVFPAGDVTPTSDGDTRRFAPPSTVATADFVAIMAMASRVYKPLDAAYAGKCLKAAEVAQAFLDGAAAPLRPKLDHLGRTDASGKVLCSSCWFTHDAYFSETQDDELWAAVELWRANHDPKLLTRIESSLPSSVSVNFDWAQVGDLALLEYLSASDPSRSPAAVTAASDALVASATTIVNNTKASAYGRGIGAMYYWGSNGVLLRTVMILRAANAVRPTPDFVAAESQQLDYVLGHNAFGRSMVTGLGFLPPMNPHHRPSSGDSIPAPWPGLLIGGPNGQDSSVSASTPGLAWSDTVGDFRSNEVAINWNAALAYAAAGLLP